MGLITWIKEKLKMLFKTDAEKAFGVETYLSPEMDAAIKLWESMEMDGGKPPWINKKVQTIRFSNTIAEELARLITQNIDIKVEGLRPGVMPEQIQKYIDKYFKKKSNEIIYKMVAFGGVMAKWDGEGIEFLTPDRFLVTDYDSSGEIHGCIFFSFYNTGKKFYTKAEWHRYETETVINEETGESETVKRYHVTSKAFRSDNQNDIGREIPLTETKWKDISPKVEQNRGILYQPLFSYIKCPIPNSIDHDSPLGVPCFSNCLVELEGLDIAMSALKTETKNSTPMMIVDQSVIQYATMNGIELPEFIADVGNLDTSNGSGSPVEMWQPTLQVTTRIEGINFYLSVIGFKCGFDPGYFVFDGQKIQMATATQVESTERRTVNTVLSYRSVLDSPVANSDGRVGAIHDIAYIINAALIINNKGEDGTYIPDNEYNNYKLFCDFADLTANAEEDRARALMLTDKGFYPKWYYLVHNEGFTEEEARAIVAEAKSENGPQESGLFGEE
jgi:A118 family predicted phage portal protein